MIGILRGFVFILLSPQSDFSLYLRIAALQTAWLTSYFLKMFLKNEKPVSFVFSRPSKFMKPCILMYPACWCLAVLATEPVLYICRTAFLKLSMLTEEGEKGWY